MLILKAVSDGPIHGYGIMRYILEATDEEVSIEEGSLYPALHRLRNKGWITSHSGRSENNRLARFYELTVAGKQHLAWSIREWKRLSQATTRALS